MSTPSETIETNKLEKAVFAAGCFWGVEEVFRGMPGVKSTQVGYTGGKTENPNYKEVCSNKTGHAEAVEVSFDPKEVSYEALLNAFWENHDPTQLNRQGPDYGEQYRSAIFYENADQQKQAEASKAALSASGKFRKQIVTLIVPAATFYPAEEYHQQYLAKRGMSHCRI